MKTNNPRKNREAQAAGKPAVQAPGNSVSGAADQSAQAPAHPIPADKMQQLAEASKVQQGVGEHERLDLTGAKAIAEAANKGASPAEIEAVAEEAATEAPLGGVPSMAADRSSEEAEAVKAGAESVPGDGDGESGEGDKSKGKDASESATAPHAEQGAAEGEPETVAFSSATEMLVQSQQEVKKAKAAAARQKRAKEMEAFQKKVHARRVRRRIFLAVFGVIVLLLLALALAFCADRWWLHDDAYDIQGTWQVDGSEAKVTITEDYIMLTDEVAYKYEIDPDSKTIKFNFGNLSGEGYYRFSLDRNQLSVTDGETNAAGDIMEDIGWWINAMIAQVRGYQLAPTIGADSVGFDRAE